MAKDTASHFRAHIDAAYLADEKASVDALATQADLSQTDRAQISAEGAKLVQRIRDTSDPGLMEVFLAEYGLSTDEGIALMCLAEALLRVPDADTIDALIEDKIAPSDWGTHLGKSTSSLVNASTWALMLTGRVLDDDRGIAQPLRRAVKRLGEPVIRTAVARAMREMGRQFVLGEDITKAMKRAAGMEAKGFTYSYDMLGEAARTEADAKHYHLSYSRAISAIAVACTQDTVAENPGISVKLSALHPRYEEAKRDRVMAELVPRVRSLAMLAKSAGQGFNIDAEEADRLSLSLDVIEAVVSDPALAGWDGFGVVVQAFGPRARHVIDFLQDLAERTDRKIMVRLVKGAYWDAEIKRAQVLGLTGFPVFTAKAHTDVSYIANARKLLGMTQRIYPQFATHNAHTVAAILHMADDMGVAKTDFEFQRLHGMGETLHKLVLKDQGTRCRIYAPVGAHEDLLAYLVRRLLENGANSSFVNQIVDEDVPPAEVAADPFDQIGDAPALPKGPDLFVPHRPNSKGWDITYRPTLDEIDAARSPFHRATWQATPLLASSGQINSKTVARPVLNPAVPRDTAGTVIDATAQDAATAIGAATPWDATPADRAEVLRQIARSYEDHADEFFALLQREAGKTLLDAVGEVREAVDFLYYYAAEAEARSPSPRGIWTCISPWNFPLAIFTGQIAAALAAGNAVLAKPAEQTCLIGHRAVQLMLAAGVPADALQYLPGGGAIGAALTSDARINGVAFTGSTPTALKIRTAMADACDPGTPLIAETGGLNAMIVDSTALPEHAVRDIVQSAFQSAGQRCSALRCLYVQDDVADKVLHMLKGAMAELSMGDPWDLATDIGPVIDETARKGITDHIEQARTEGRILFELTAPETGTFVAPTVIKVKGIADLEREIFGPVLHIATYKARDLDKVIEAINATGYGLTFGLHTRIDDRVQQVVEQIHAGNIYVNRNQIGAVVGSQPFGGEGLSGTGPKAGGPLYMPRFAAMMEVNPVPSTEPVDLPGPTGESNRLSAHPRGLVACLGPDATTQADVVTALGGTPFIPHHLSQVEAVTTFGGVPSLPEDFLEPEALLTLDCVAVVWDGDTDTARAYERALAHRPGPIVPLITGALDAGHVLHERHVCIDTTAAGGNAALLAEVGGAN